MQDANFKNLTNRLIICREALNKRIRDEIVYGTIGHKNINIE